MATDYGVFDENADDRTLSAAIKTSGAGKGKRALTNVEVREWRRMYKEGAITNKAIRAATGLSSETVARMLRGETYTNVQDAVPEAIPAEVLGPMMERLMEVQRKRDAGIGQDTVAGRVKALDGFKDLNEAGRRKLAGLGLIKKEDVVQQAPLTEEEKAEIAKQALAELTGSPDESELPSEKDVFDELYGTTDTGDTASGTVEP